MSDSDGELYFDKYDWQNAVASSAGPSHAPTRHVLLTVSLHMNAQGACWPSQATLARRTGLDVRVVRRCLERAEREGWLLRSEQGRTGQGWRLTRYQGTIPEHVELEDKPWLLDSSWRRADTVSSRSHVEPRVEHPPAPDVRTNAPNVRTGVQERADTVSGNVRTPCPTNSSSELLIGTLKTEGLLTQTACIEKSLQEKKPGTQPEPSAAKPNGSGKPNRRLQKVLQEAKKLGAAKQDLTAPIQQLLSTGLDPHEVQRQLARRGCTLDDVARAYALLREAGRGTHA